MSGKHGRLCRPWRYGGAALASSAAVLRRAAKPPVKHETRTPAHLAHATALTRTGKRDMTNRKPYRSKPMKAMAKRMAAKGKDGAFRSAAPVRFHD